MPTLPRRRRAAHVVAALAVGASTLLAVPAASSAADGPVPEEAVRIVATAVEGAPLRVVTTSTGAAGRPLVRTTPVADRTDALAVVVRALADPDVDTVSMAQPVRAAASDDTLRPRQWALDTLRADPALAARLSRAGGERVRGFTWKATAAAYDNVYSMSGR